MKVNGWLIKQNDWGVKETWTWDTVQHFNHLKWTEQPNTFGFAKSINSWIVVNHIRCWYCSCTPAASTNSHNTSPQRHSRYQPCAISTFKSLSSLLFFFFILEKNVLQNLKPIKFYEYRKFYQRQHFKLSFLCPWINNKLSLST